MGKVRRLSPSQIKRNAELAEQIRQIGEAEERRLGTDETRPVGIVRSTKLSGNGRTAKYRYEYWDGTQWLPSNKKTYENYKNRSAEDSPAVTGDALPSNPTFKGVGAVESQEAIKSIKTEFAKSNFESKTNNNLRYPLASVGADQDYIQFGVLEYVRQGLTGGPAGTNESEDELKARILGTVTLPIPSTIGDNNVQNYGPGSLNFLQEQGLRVAESAIGGRFTEAQGRIEGVLNSVIGAERSNALATNYFANQAIGAFGGNIDINQLLARSNGSIINPNMELLFTGPGLRNFTFQFKMTPRSQQEGEAIRQIIRVFKRHSAPKQGAQGNFLKTPDIFQIRYLSGEKSHPFLNRFKLCALANMQVNYTGDGVYATYDNGTPVSMIMTLNFQELTPVYAEDYENTEGVGY